MTQLLRKTLFMVTNLQNVPKTSRNNANIFTYTDEKTRNMVNENSKSKLNRK